MIQEYELLQKDKSRWGIFSVNRNTIKTEEWSTSVGGGLPTFKCVGITENDTTFRITKYIDNGKEYPRDYTYHFRKFSSKPDSTNRFIP